MQSPRLAPCRVPEITAYFWILKSLSTAMGESTSDFLVHRLGPVPAVLLGFVAFVLALARQLRTRRYRAWNYWTAVTMVGVFGTMVADVVHIGLHVPYVASMIFFAVVLATVFLLWSKRQSTLSIHSINSLERELFYWAAVVATFALGTAVGDFTAISLHLGYMASIAIFAGVIAIPAAGFGLLRWNAIFSFWFAYVATRPLGASVADALGKPKNVGGVGIGSGWVALTLTLMIAVLVAYLAKTHRDVQPLSPREVRSTAM
jgi:uncharacterized membrane-anchored protein